MKISVGATTIEPDEWQRVRTNFRSYVSNTPEGRELREKEFREKEIKVEPRPRAVK